MLSAVIALALFGGIALFWVNARATSELASHYGRRACEEAGVQWLDHSVMLERISLRRAPDGWLRLLRRYRFDISINGQDRHRGHLELLGRELCWIHMPQHTPEKPVQSVSPLLYLDATQASRNDSGLPPQP